LGREFLIKQCSDGPVMLAEVKLLIAADEKAEARSGF
jgi:hypothetical protein